MSIIVNTHVGKRINKRRIECNYSVAKLAGHLSCKPSEIRAFENGAKRPGSSHLYKVSKVLDVPIAYFFEGLLTEKKGDSA